MLIFRDAMPLDGFTPCCRCLLTRCAADVERAMLLSFAAMLAAMRAMLRAAPYFSPLHLLRHAALNTTA